ncbi:Diacylglycerol kinase, catalytic domain [Dillenia turbinata]|uniref:sphingosine kinase n=1 Tax=Dillenia turbinata TaxID=194707 RepID=A0AAN8UNK1_9MAGN
MERDREGPIISDRVLINGTIVPVTLNADGRLRWSFGGGRQKSLSVKKEVLGFTTEGAKIRVRTIVERSDGLCCIGDGQGGGTLIRKDLVFEPLSEESQRLWCQKLQLYLDSLNRPKRLFIFVNPFGGKKSASKIFLDDVKPLIEDAGIQFTLLETKYQLHAKEVVQSLDLTKYDGVVCVSGDGILVVNGLLGREDWDTAIKMPIGVVPAGTGNGMAKSLLDSVGEPCSAVNATVAIIQGHKRSLDVATILQGQTRFFSVLMLAWGLVADIDIESEKYRWMGSARIDFYAIQRIVHLRKYNGRVSFVPAPGFETFGEPINSIGGSSGTPDVPNTDEERPAKLEQHGYLGPATDSEISGWRAIEGPFVSIWLHNVPWGGEDAMPAPDAKFSDGYLDLIVVRDCPKVALLQLMTDLSKGGHVKSPHVMYLKVSSPSSVAINTALLHFLRPNEELDGHRAYRVKAFVLEPGTCMEDPTKEGIIDVDGEVLARGRGTYKCDQKTLMTYDKLQIAVDRGLATVFCPIT